LFEEGQRDAARAFMRRQRWVDAQWAWSVILALHPQDREAIAQHAAATDAASKAVAETLPLAKLAQQKGEWADATRLYLKVLSLDPDQMEAAEALRQVELQRSRRGVVQGSWARYATPAGSVSHRTRSSRPATPDAAPGSGRADAATAPPVANQDMEHASLLAGQGELDAAIALLAPLLDKPGPAAGAARKQLLALYLDKAAQLEKADRASAVTSLEMALRLAPDNKDALARLQALRASATDPGSKPQTANR
jgi:tetratricopeptide (TPR) repeat protein